MTWITLGFYYVFVGQGVMQVLGYEEYEKPEDCFKAAVTVMMDQTDRRHMACVPLLKETDAT